MIGAQLDVTAVVDISEKKLLLVRVNRKSDKASYLPNRYLQWGKINKKFTLFTRIFLILNLIINLYKSCSLSYF